MQKLKLFLGIFLYSLYMEIVVPLLCSFFVIFSIYRDDNTIHVNYEDEVVLNGWDIYVLFLFVDEQMISKRYIYFLQ